MAKPAKQLPAICNYIRSMEPNISTMQSRLFDKI